MSEQIIPIDEIHAAAKQAAADGIDECPEKFKQYPHVWAYELRVAKHYLEKLSKQLSTVSIVRRVSDAGFEISQG